jgi:tRNA A37 threonylcarbamoyltransferase TsaD
LVLSSSGGHSSIVKILDGKFNFKELFTIDAMRKKSRNLPDFTGIGAIYSYVANALRIGGPISSAPVLFKYAKKGDKRRFVFYKQIASGFNIAKLDFSAMQKLINQTISAEMNKNHHLSRKFICDIAASFEYSMARLIGESLIKLAKKEKAREIHLVGGISANDTLRRIIKSECLKNGFAFKYPKKKSYCTDNAAMIASLGYYKYRLLSIKERKRLLRRKIKIDSNLKLEEMALNQRKNAY